MSSPDYLPRRRSTPMVASFPVQAPAARSRPGLVTRVRRAWRAARREAAQPAAFMLPLRLFIGLGWLRASAEKLTDLGWLDGSSLATFLGEQYGGGHIPFPWYQDLVLNVFLPYAVVLGWMVIIGQALVGLAIATGTLTNAALLAGLFMNVNFLLVGRPNPNAFYIVIEVALLATSAGAVFGLDRLLARDIRSPLLVAQPPARRGGARAGRWAAALLALAFLAGALYAVPYIKTFEPAASIEDPAMLVAILCASGAVWALLICFRGELPSPVTIIERPVFVPAITGGDHPRRSRADRKPPGGPGKQRRRKRGARS